MEIKQNEATKNRPEGSRPIDATTVFTDLVEVSRQLRTEKAWETNDLNGITVFKTDQMTAVLTLIKERTTLKKIMVNGLFTILVLDGKLLVETDDGNYTLGPANMLNIHPNKSHSLTAKKETLLLQITNHMI
jgi:quercetin dioxygenase-like cupin family protein